MLVYEREKNVKVLSGGQETEALCKLLSYHLWTLSLPLNKATENSSTIFNFQIMEIYSCFHSYVKKIVMYNIILRINYRKKSGTNYEMKEIQFHAVNEFKKNKSFF